MNPLHFVAAILALITAISGVFAFGAFANGQQTQAPIVFMIGLVGMVVVIAIDQKSDKPKAK